MGSSKSISLPAHTAIATLGDPIDPYTWSGTPSCVLGVFDRAGAPVEAFGVDQTPAQKARALIEYEASRALYGGRIDYRATRQRFETDGRADYRFSRRSRHDLSRRVRRAATERRARSVVHFAHPSIIPVDSAFTNHYFCDTTWRSTFRWINDPARHPPRLARALEELERQTFRKVDQFMTMSRAVADDLRTHYGIPPERVTAVGTGHGSISVNGARDKDFGEKRILLAARQRFEEKGGLLLLEAMRHVLELDPDVRLSVVGGPRGFDREADLPNVETLGWVSRSQLESLFHRASLYAMPAYYEPWGLVYLEALVSKTPVLGLRRNGFPEIAGDGEFGFIVDEPDPKALASALVGAVNEPDLLRKKAEAGQSHVLSHHTWERTAERIARALDPARPGVGGG